MQLPDKASADVVASWFRLENVRQALVAAEAYDRWSVFIVAGRRAARELAALPVAGLPAAVLDWQRAAARLNERPFGQDLPALQAFNEVADELHRQLSLTGVTVAPAATH